MTVRQRFSDFIESLEQPRRKFGVVCFLLAFLCADFLIGGIYFLTSFFTLKTIGPAAEMAANIAETYKISVYVDTSEYLWWSVPFFALAIITGAVLGWYVNTHRYMRGRAKRPVRPKERIRAQEDALVAVRVKAVNPEQAKKQDLRNNPPSWLLDPLAVVNNTGTAHTANAEPFAARPTAEMPRETYKQPYEMPEQPYRKAPAQPFSYSDFVNPPHSVSTPHNTLQRPSRKDAEIPYAGSLQYVERTDKKKKTESPYSPYQY